MGGYRYRMNMTTGKLDLVRGLSGASTSPVSAIDIFKPIAIGDNTITHSANARMRTIEVYSLNMTNLFTLANELKTDYNLHIADAAQHTSGVDGVNVVTAADAIDWDTLYTLTNDLLTQYTVHNADAELGIGWVYHAGTNTADYSCTTSPVANTNTAVVAALNDLKNVYNLHDNDGTSHGITGSHQIVASYGESVWEMNTMYAPKEDATDLLNNVIIPALAIDFVKVTVYF